MKTIFLKLEYYGAPFSGFARQPGQLTVQGNLEEALSKVLNSEIVTTCAGRTDSGVHAKSQYVSFPYDSEIDCFKLKGSLNSLTHDDIYIIDIMQYNFEFSARFDAKSREYSYFICNQEQTPLFMKDFSWHIAKDLNIENMKAASKYLIGEKDFKSFCVAASAKDKTTMRNVQSIDIFEQEIYGDSILEIRICANAFLHSMVRTIIGTLVQVGLGNRSPESMKEILDAKDRQAAGENAPAKGLVLMNVVYDKI
ncbi:MAG: tRNA pseudouridine(38-40) synthase TruA [Coriobacteriia bacterium]|nr:tRNA pseudouridine(38-40) synthase TruA [Coriobacteriia bacterium]